MNKRAKVKNVILNITYPVGQEEIVNLDGDSYEGLFFNDRAVTKILAPFYNTYKGEVTPRYVEQLWNFKNQNGMLPPYMSKSIDCFPGIPEMKFSGYETGRPRVTGITMELRYPDGRVTAAAIDPAVTEALCWSDRAVLEILAPFYNTYDGEVTPRYVEQLWNFKNQNGMPPPYMSKSIDCTPGIPEMKSFVFLKAA